MQSANKQTAVYEQRLSKYVPAETKTHTTIEELSSVQSAYIEENWGSPLRWGLAVQLISAREAEKSRGCGWVDKTSAGAAVWTREAEDCPLLEAAAREPLVKTHQAGKCLMSVVEICKVWLVIALLAILSGVYKWSIIPILQSIPRL
jgi:hypothetical protein